MAKIINTKEIISGHTAEASGERWVRVQQGDHDAFVPLSACAGRATGLPNQLARQGVIIIGSEAITSALSRIAALTDFPTGDLVDRIGWNGPHFVMQDGSVFSPEGRRPFANAVEPVRGKNDQRGSLDKWKTKVAGPVSEMTLPMFVLSLAFVAPLLALTERDGNFGFELVGGKGIGKSTLQRLMGSVVGGIGAGGGGRYNETFDTTLNALETQLKAHSDMPLILDEANLFMGGATERQRAGALQAFSYKMATGDEKGRLGASRERGIRTAYLTSSNEPLASLIGTGSAADAAGDRLITIQLTDARPFGVFDFLPQGYENGSALAEKLIRAAGKNHGVAMRAYLAKLVQERADDDKALRKRIRNSQRAFLKNVVVDKNVGAEVRVAEAFGLVYAAGTLATRYGVLPDDFGHIGKAVAACYNMHRQSSFHGSALDRLIAIADGPDIVQLASKRVPITKEQLIAAPGFLMNHDDARELMMLPKTFKRLFPDHLAFLKLAEIRKVMEREEKNATVKRKIAANHDKQRVFCFKLPKAGS